jgi:AcrR family transcriptional regulator
MPKPKGSTAKSAQTRAAIEAAARELFASSGFEKTSLRDIGLRAGIDASMIIRYFGSKDELFARVAAPDLKMPELERIDRARIGEVLVQHFLEQWEDGNGGLPVLLRSATSNAEAAERLREVFRRQVLPAVERGGGEHPMDRAGLIASQLLGLALTRYILKLPPVVAMPRDLLVREIGATVQRYAAGKLEM